jgi:lipoic acid synthetase
VGKIFCNCFIISVLISSCVCRDELEDQGAGHFSKTVTLLKQKCPELLVECLTPDFRGNATLISMVANSGLDVFAHNVETVERLQRRVRDYRAGYMQSLNVLQIAKQANPKLVTKTSLMLGLGEKEDEIRKALVDLREKDVDIVTFGQYLRPTKRHITVQRYVTPDGG